MPRMKRPLVAVAVVRACWARAGRVARIGRDDADAELDTAGLHPCEGQGGQGIVAAGRDVGNPEAVEGRRPRPA